MSDTPGNQKGLTKGQRMSENIKSWAHWIERIIELVMALVVITAVLIDAVNLPPLLKELADSMGDMDIYESILTRVLDIVIGVEFFRLLAAPDIKVVLEVMMFAMTRHMIVENSTALENLLTVIGIGIIAFLQLFLRGRLLPFQHRPGMRAGRKDAGAEDPEKNNPA